MRHCVVSLRRLIDDTPHAIFVGKEAQPHRIQKARVDLVDDFQVPRSTRARIGGQRSSASGSRGGWCRQKSAA